MSVLAAVEVRSAVRRRQALGDITSSDAEFALAIAGEETRRFVEQPFTEIVLQRANDLIDRSGLRALDAIQLASALATRDVLTKNNTFVFIASDHKLLKAAESEDISVWDPSSTPRYTAFR